jgi:hypothetical protein
MNVFYLHNDPKTCAELHNDKHVVKMIIEYAQLMSTAHRVLDGKEYIEITANNRKMKRWRHPNAEVDSILMKATHINHPSAIWVRKSKDNYVWLNRMWNYLLLEYTHRYGKVHSCERYKMCLYPWPEKIPMDVGFTEPTPAMPEMYKVYDNSLQSYINYYNGAKRHLASWKKREIPSWYVTC